MTTVVAAAGVITPLLVPLASPVLRTVNVAVPAVVRDKPVNVATPFTAEAIVVPVAKLAVAPPTLAAMVTLAVLLVTLLPY